MFCILDVRNLCTTTVGFIQIATFSDRFIHPLFSHSLAFCDFSIHPPMPFLCALLHPFSHPWDFTIHFIHLPLRYSYSFIFFIHLLLASLHPSIFPLIQQFILLSNLPNPLSI
ncbi:hypothetical protein FKM82_012156 [Ascaphus truei]